MSPTGDDLGDITMTPSRAMPLPTTLTQKSPRTPDGAALDSEARRGRPDGLGWAVGRGPPPPRGVGLEPWMLSQWAAAALSSLAGPGPGRVGPVWARLGAVPPRRVPPPRLA